MKPVLFPAGATAFNTNGLGRLSNAISCFVEEERNGKYELELEYPVDGIHFSDITHSRIIKAIPADGKDPQPFRIYYISKPINGKVTVRAEHISYQLNHIPLVPPLAAATPAEALLKIENNTCEVCPFEFWTDKSSQGSWSVDVPISARAALGGEKGSVLQAFGGGEFEWDGYTVRLYQERGIDRNVTVRYGKNLTDLRQEESIDATITGIAPYWCGTPKGSTAEETVILSEKVLHSQNASYYPYQRTVPLDLSSEFDDKPTESQLREAARAYMTANSIGVPKVSIKISFVALWQTEEYRDIANLERVNLCDTVHVVFPSLGVNATAKVVRTKYNVLNEMYDEIEIGEASGSMAKTLRSDIDKSVDISTENVRSAKSELRKAIEHATELITGGLGGYVVFSQNEDGEPEEILIMDQPDVSRAVNVIRLNKNGIGFSRNGYGGPFANAWTIDGRLVADFITTGTLTAVLIKAGILSDVNNLNYWNMETGEFRLASTATVGGKTVQKIAEDAGDAAVNAQTQQSIFNKLTNNGQTQGIYLSNGRLYINGTYIQTGTITIKKGTKTTFSANADTGVVNIIADSFSLSNGDTIASIAENKASAAVNAQTQQSIFNKLTNNGQTQGIYLSGGKVYINAAYIATGILADANDNTTFDLSTGTLTMKKGSIKLGGGTFEVTNSGALTATSATIEGTIKAGSSSGYWVKLSSTGEMQGGYGNSQYGYIDFSASSVHTPTGQIYNGVQIQGGILRISTHMIAVARSTSTSTTATTGGNGTMNYISNIQDNGDGTMSWTTTSVQFINGIMVSQL